MDISTLYANTSKFVANYDAITDDFHNDHGPDFIDLNIEAMRAGEDAEGNPTPEYANASYGQLKASRGGNPTNWDFNFHGDLIAAMKIRDGEIFSTDPKAAKLQRAVPAMFGVQEKRLTPYIKDQYLPDLDKMIRNELGI